MTKVYACKSVTLSKIMLIAILITLASLVSSLTEEELIRDLEEFNSWAEKNKDNNRFKVKKFQQQVSMLDSTEDFGGVEALSFLKIYRRHEMG